jgi:hypothetical protein
MYTPFSIVVAARMIIPPALVKIFEQLAMQLCSKYDDKS